MYCCPYRIGRFLKAFLFVLLCSAANLSAADVFWKASVDGDWNDPNNWLGNNVPGVNDDVFITTAGTYTVTLDVVASVRSLEVGGTSGTQSLVSVGQNIAVGFDSRIGTHGNLFLGTADFSGGVILENFGSIGLLSGGIFSELHNHGSVFMQNADIFVNPKLDGPVVNFTTGVIQIFSADFFSTVGEMRSPFVNSGLIELKSLNLSGTSTMEVQDTFVNRDLGTIESLPGSDQQVAIQLVGLSLFSNEGTIQVGTPTVINNSSAHPVTNAGLMIVTSSILRVSQALGTSIESPGRMHVDDGQNILIQGGSFSPGTSGSISGSGSITFASTSVVDGLLRCTSALTGMAACVLTTSARLFNSSRILCLASNTFNGEVENATGGVIELRGLDATSSVLFVNNTMTNNGVMLMTSSSLSSNRIALLRICDTQLFCNGSLQSWPTPGAPVMPHTVQNKNSSFFLTGHVIVATNATLNWNNAGSRIHGDGGTFLVSGFNSVFNIANRGSLVSTFASITISSIRTVGPGAQLRVAQTTRSSFHIFSSSFSTTATLFNSGLLSMVGGECIGQSSMFCNGPGAHSFENIIISGRLFCRSTSSSFDCVDVTSRSGSDIHMRGFGSLGGCNRFRGSFTVGTTASCFLIDPQRGPVTSSLGQKNLFSQGLTNHGCIQVQTFATNATIGILNGQFHNTGKLELGTSPAGFTLFCTGSSILLNGTGGSIVNQSDGGTNGRPGVFTFSESSQMLNFGQIVFSTTLNIATTDFNFGGETIFLNDGVFVFRSFFTRSIISVSSSTVFINRGLLEFDQGKSGAAGGLFGDGEALLPPVNSGAFVIRNFSTPNTFMLHGKDSVNNTGSMLFENNSAPTRVELRDSSLIVNEGDIEFIRCISAKLLMRGTTRLLNNTPGAVRFKDADSACLRLIQNSEYANCAGLVFDGCTAATIRIDDFARLLNKVGAKTEARNLTGEGSLQLTTSAVLRNAGFLSFNNFATTCIIFASGNSSIENETGGVFEISTGAILNFQMSQTANMLNCGLLRLRSMSNATMNLTDLAHFRTKPGSTTMFGPLLTEGTVELHNTSTFQLGGETNFLENQHSALRMFDTSRMFIATTSILSFSGAPALDMTSSLRMESGAQFNNHGRCEMENSSHCSIQMLNSCRIINSTGATIKMSTSGVARLAQEGSSLFINDGTLGLLTVSRATVEVRDTAKLQINSGGILDIRGPKLEGKVSALGSGVLDNGGTVRIKTDSSSCLVKLGDNARLRSSTGSTILFESSAGGNKSGVRVVLGGNSQVDNGGVCRFRNFATTATIFLGDASRWDMRTTGSVTADSSGKFRILCYGGSLFNNCGQVQCLTTTSGSVILGGNSLYNNKFGASTIFGDGASGGLKLKAATNAIFSNGGTVRFRNFATTATIFLGDSARWQNRTNATLDVNGGASGGSGVRVDLSGSSQSENDGTVRLRNFATTATIFLGDSSRWENRASGGIFSDTTSRTRLLLFGDSRFNNCGEFSTRFASTGNIIIGGDARLNNKTGGRLFFCDLGTKLKVETSTNAIFNNVGQLKIDRCPSATFKLFDNSRFQNRGKMAVNSATTTAGVSFVSIPTSVFSHSGCIDITRALVRIKLPRVTVLGATEASVKLATTSVWHFETEGGVEFHHGRTDLRGRFSGDGRLMFRDAKIDVQDVKLAVGGTNAAIKLVDTEWNSSATVSPWITRVPLCLGGRSTLNVVMTTANRTIMRASTEGLLHLNFKLPLSNTGQWIFNRTIPSSRIDFDPGLQFNNQGRILIDNAVTSTVITLGTHAQFCHRGLLSITTAELNFVHGTGAHLKFVSGAIVEIDRSTVNIVSSAVLNTTIPGNVVLRGGGVYNVGNVGLAGRLVPGRSPGKLVFPDDITMSSTATLEFELAGTTTAGIAYDQICADDVALDGTLDLSFINGFIPSDGDRFVLMQYNSVTGAFAAVTWASVSATPTLEIGATEAVLTFSGGVNTSLVNIDVYLHGYWDGAAHRRTPLLLELRTGAELLTSSTALLASTMLGTTATASFVLENLPEDDYWVILRHGGHLPAASTARVNIAPGTTTLDFTNPANVVNGAIQLLPLTIGATTYNVLRTGDMNNNQDVGSDDFIQYFLPNFGVANPGFVPALD